MTFYVERSELERAGVQSKADLWEYIKRRVGGKIRKAYIFTGRQSLLVIVRQD